MCQELQPAQILILEEEPPPFQTAGSSATVLTLESVTDRVAAIFISATSVAALMAFMFAQCLKQPIQILKMIYQLL